VRCHRGIACTAAAARNTPTHSSQSLPQFAASAAVIRHRHPRSSRPSSSARCGCELVRGHPARRIYRHLQPCHHAGRCMPSCVTVWLSRPTLTCMRCVAGELVLVAVPTPYCMRCVAGELGLLLAWRSFVGMAHGRWKTHELPNIFFSNTQKNCVFCI